MSIMVHIYEGAYRERGGGGSERRGSSMFTRTHI